MASSTSKIVGSGAQKIQELLLKGPKHVTVWSDGVIEPYFFENEAGATVTVNGLRYREMINVFLWPELDGIDLDKVYFQQDGAMCHTSNETIDILRENLTINTSYWKTLYFSFTS